MTRKGFIDQYGYIINPLGKQYGIFPEIIYGQAFIEGSDGKGNFGESYAMKYGNNTFNIRPGGKWKGATVSNPYVTSESKIFRAYDSIEDGIKDYFTFLASNPRYKKAGVFNSATVEDQAHALQAAGFAGNSQTYAPLIIKLANSVRGLMGKAVDLEKKVVKNVSDNAALYAGAALLLVGGAVAYEKKWIRF